MPDTLRGQWPNTNCTDCKNVGDVCFFHQGPLVPPGESGYFCDLCFSARSADYNTGRVVRPLGQKAPEVKCPVCEKKSCYMGPASVEGKRQELFICDDSCVPEGSSVHMLDDNSKQRGPDFFYFFFEDQIPHFAA